MRKLIRIYRNDKSREPRWLKIFDILVWLTEAAARTLHHFPVVQVREDPQPLKSHIFASKIIVTTKSNGEIRTHHDDFVRASEARSSTRRREQLSNHSQARKMEMLQLWLLLEHVLLCFGNHEEMGHAHD